MPTPKRGPRLGSGPAHQKLLLANLASDLFRHGRIRTTEAKAKAVQPYAERLITKARRGDLASRRQVLSKLRDRDVVAYLFDEIGPRFADRNGGYTRVLKLGPRPGDGAAMALIELVDQGADTGDETIEEAKQSRSRGLFGRRRRRQPEPEGGGSTAVLDELVAAAEQDTAGGQDEDESPESGDSPESADSPDSVDSPESADSDDEAGSASDEDDTDGGQDEAPKA